VTRILHDARYRERARTVQALMQACPGPQNAAAFLRQRFAVPA
jgi:UDP:flavonoid glycosyltransferase YjiC (YdhE family)